MRTQYDVVVIGGGPAGASAAFFLVRAGQNVLLLEQESLPRPKPCAGAVAREALDNFPFSCDEAIVEEVTAVGYAWQEHEPRFVSIPADVIVLVDRARFDAHLLAHCGATVRDRCAVTVVHQKAEGITVETETGEDFSAAYAVLASGPARSLPRTLGIPAERPALALVTEIRNHDLLQRFHGRPFFTFGLVRGGYFWLFPKGDHLSAGLFTTCRRVRRLRDKLHRALRRWGLSADDAAIQSYPAPLYRPGVRRQAGRVLLVGDAAALADPFLGEGIRHAITSGRLAAQAIAVGRPADYPAQVEAIIGCFLRGARLVAGLVHFTPWLATRIAANFPAISAAFGRFFQGKQTYAEILGGLPRYLLGLSKGG